MGWPYKKLVRPLLFTQDAETAHNLALKLLGHAARRPFVDVALEKMFAAPELPVGLFGLNFPNPVGLAAGMDKFAVAMPVWEKLGFGFTELGGVTWHEQPGNPAPRMFRSVPDEAIVNRMGFNNPGAEMLARKLAEWKRLDRWPGHPVGINLGKSKVTPLKNAAEDYANSFHALRQHADFFVINVSSPNTPGLRQLQDKAALEEILIAVQQNQHPILRKPVLVKVAPDLSFEALDEILELTFPLNVAGIIATNTTITRPQTNEINSLRVYSEDGGLSGRPLRRRSTEVIRHLHRQMKGRLPIIGVGGIFNAADAWEKLSAGASLLQIYTGLVYEGPDIAKTIVTGLIQQMERDGVRSLKEIIGSSE